MYLPWFFERLGIAATSDSKQIKRAYARALKRIDQQTEREAFEALRAAYEQALAWAAEHRVDMPSQDDTAYDAPIRVVPEHPVPVDDGERRHVELPGADEATDQGQSQPADPPSHTSNQAPHQLSQQGLPLPAPVAPTAPTDAQEQSTDRDTPSVQARQQRAHDLSWLSIRQWVARLMDPQDVPYEHLLDQALDDPHLQHLDARHQLDTMLIDALYRAPVGQRDLFALAAARFDWAAQGVLTHQHDPRSTWVSQVIDQSLLWSSLDPGRAAAYTAALDAAIATDRPTPAQAWRHRGALNDLSHEFQAWSTLSLPSGRIDAWRLAYEALPAGYMRRMRAQQAAIASLKWLWRAIKFTVALFDSWASRALVAMLAFSVVIHFVAGEDTRTPAQRTSENVMRIAYANADRAPVPGPRALGQATPIPLDSLMGKIDRRSCASTHEMLHKREPRVFDDPPLIASLGAHAMLCTANNLWPQLTDPIVRCLETESWTANNLYRPQANAHCVAAQVGKQNGE